MNTGRAKFWLGFALVAVALAAGFIKLRSSSASLEAARRECADLKAQVEARDQTISDLQAKLANHPSPELTGRFVSPPSSPEALSQLVHRVELLAVQQTNILALVQSLASAERTSDLAGQRLQGQQRIVASLDAQAAAQQQKLEAAKQKVQQLALSLQVPDEVALMDAAAGLDALGLKKYWPYFEAKRARDEIHRFITIVNMKAVSEKLDLESEAAKRPAQ